MNEVVLYQFGDLPIEAIKTADGVALSDEQIGMALGYENPGRSIANLVKRNTAELAGLATFTELVRVEGDRHVTRQMRVWGEEGVMAITFLAKTEKAIAFRRWARETLYAIRHRDPITEVDRVAAIMSQVIPALGGKVLEISATVARQEERLSAVEEVQRITDPREIESRMFTLHRLKKILVEGTKDRPDPVSYPGFWSALKERLHIASFQNRALLTVPMLDEAIQYATNWCFGRGVDMPSLFDDGAAQA